MFGLRLRELRKNKGLTQRELAQILQISTSSVAMYELGKRDPDIEMILRLADFFDVSSDYLLGTETKSASDILTEKDKKEIDAILQNTKNILLNQQGLMYDGEPTDEESVIKIIEAMKYGMERAKERNKKYAPKKRSDYLKL